MLRAAVSEDAPGAAADTESRAESGDDAATLDLDSLVDDEDGPEESETAADGGGSDSTGAADLDSMEFDSVEMDPPRKSGGALHRLHCFCLEFDGACEVQRRVPTDWVIEPIDVSGYGSFSLAS